MTTYGVDEDPHVSLDLVLNALADRYRRKLLTELLNDNPQDINSFIASKVNGKNITAEQLKIRMAHIHLPKLEDAGFIEWNQDTHDAQRGSRFEEIYPLVELLNNHTDEPPD